jgi:hypothetical protein
MGNRVNFGFQQSNDNTIFLYGHWAGSGMLERLADAVVKARPRWSDESYATRIAISQIVGDDWGSETGWGLHVNEIGDNEHKVPIVNFQNQTFKLYEEDLETLVFEMPLVNFATKYSSILV